jgi:pyruvate carboxylase
LSKSFALRLAASLFVLQVVNGPDHPGAVGAPPSKYAPPAPKLPAELAGQALHGWREVYLREGAEGWAKAVRAHQGLLLTDTTM